MVVADVRFDGPAREREEELYLPYRQASMTLVVSSALSTNAVAGTLRRALARIDPEQAFSEIRPE